MSMNVNQIFEETATTKADGSPAVGATKQKITSGAAHVYVRSGGSFTPSDYDTDLTMDGTAQGVQLAPGVKLGLGRVHFFNAGSTGQNVKIAFGTSELDAEGNLNMTTDGAPEKATTGFTLAPAVDGDGRVTLKVPATATHYAVGNANDSETPVVSVTQGV